MAFTVKNLGQRLLAARLRCGASQWEFANKAGIREKTYWQYEKNRCFPPLEKISSLANAWGLSIDDLLTADESESESEEKEV